MQKPPDFPWENSSIFVMKIKSFTMAKTTFFQKRSKRWHGFPPNGMIIFQPSPIFVCAVSMEIPLGLRFFFARQVRGLAGSSRTSTLVSKEATRASTFELHPRRFQCPAQL